MTLNGSVGWLRKRTSRLMFWATAVANRKAGVQHRVLPFRADTALVGRLRVRHHNSNLCSEMPLVVAEGLGAFATEIHVSIHSHNSVSLFQNSPIFAPKICLCSKIQ